MPTHLYCLLPAKSDLTPPVSVRALAAGDVTAWVGDAGADALSRDARVIAKATVEHDRVIGAALGQGVTPVPSSLADPYANDVEAARDIAAHAPAIVDALRRVADRVEMTTLVALTDSSPPPDAPGRGRAYLEQLRGQPSRVGAIADRFEDALREIAGSPRRRINGATLALSHLVPPGAIHVYRSTALAHAGPGYRIVIDGPRAPYSFARFSPRHGILTEGSASAA